MNTKLSSLTEKDLLQFLEAEAGASIFKDSTGKNFIGSIARIDHLVNSESVVTEIKITFRWILEVTVMIIPVKNGIRKKKCKRTFVSPRVKTRRDKMVVLVHGQTMVDKLTLSTRHIHRLLIERVRARHERRLRALKKTTTTAKT
ncbi:MAG: hypothetical protein AAB917_01880 [Patescibacteria group bacterium]